MSDFRAWLRDENDDGFIDDISVQVVAAPACGSGVHEYWSALLELAARAGLETHALAFPFVIASESSASRPAVTVETAAHASELVPADVPVADDLVVDAPDYPVSDCLLNLFTIDGALDDADRDLLPDGTRVTFELPDELRTPLGVALANLAARLGVESGGINLPLVGHGRPTFRVVPGDGPAQLRIVENGWLAEGDSDELAALVECVAAEWPHFGAPETGGVRGPVLALGRVLAGFGAEPYRPGAIAWEMQWSARWEVERLLETFRSQILPSLAGSPAAQITVFASEPSAQRRALRETIQRELGEHGLERVDVRVLSAFKVGLSWLRETVLPALAGRDVSRLRISYQPYEPASDKSLDLRIRWLQELFPGNEIAAQVLGIPVDAIEIVEAEVAGPTYTAQAFGASGEVLGAWDCRLLSRTLPFLSPFPEEGDVCVTTGGFVVERDGETREYPIETDLERFWTFWQQEALPKVIADVRETGSVTSDRQPFFGELFVEIVVSEPNESVGVREENDSAAEALHEDIYFNALDALELLGLRTSGEKTSAPGAVVPVVRVQPGVTPHARVRLRHAPEIAREPIPRTRVDALHLDSSGLLSLELAVEGELSPRAEQRLKRFMGAQPVDLDVSAVIDIGTARLAIRLTLPEMLKADGWFPTSHPWTLTFTVKRCSTRCGH